MLFSSILLNKVLIFSLNFVVFSADAHVKRESNGDVIFNLLSGNADWTLASTLIKNALLYDVPESSRLCLTELSAVANALFHLEEWALSMLDAFGKPGSGILEGNVVFDGNYKECINTKKDEISGRYCWAQLPTHTLASFAENYLNFSKGRSLIEESGISLKAAICIPSSCATQIGPLASLIKEKLGFITIDLPQLQIECVESPLKHLHNDTMTLIAIGVLTIFVLLATIGTCIDLKSENQNRTHTRTFLVFFSAYSNGKKLFQWKHEKHLFLEINGLRIIAMLIVINAHSFSVFPSNSDNPINVAQHIGHFLSLFQFSFFSVDIFFAITGFLTLNSILQKKFTEKPSILRFSLNYVIERYLRMAVVPGIYLLVFYTGITYYLGSGPYWENVDPRIFTDWWGNILFICNLRENKCLPVWWFMAASMQLHVLSLCIVIPIIYRRYWLSALNGGAILISIWCWLFWVTYHNDSPADFSLLHNRGDIATFFRLMKPFDDWIYRTPFYHYGAYISGMLASWILFRYKDRIIFSKVQLAFSWLLWCVVVFFTMSFRYYEPDLFFKSVHVMLGTSIMGLCLAWLLVACSTNNGGIVSSILGWKLFVFLSKLTMTVYLTHNLVIVHFQQSEDARVHFSDSLLFASFLRNWIVSFVIAIPVSLIIDAPLELITNVIKIRFFSS